MPFDGPALLRAIRPHGARLCLAALLLSVLTVVVSGTELAGGGAATAAATTTEPPDSSRAAPATPAPAGDSLAASGVPWTITGEHLEGSKTGVTKLVSPSARQEGTTVTAREGLWYRNDDLLTLTRDVVLEDSSRVLTGDRASYDRRRGLAILTGHVKGMGPEGNITARELWYWRIEGKLELIDSVLAVEGTRSIRADRLVYDTRSRTAVATGSVVLSDTRDSTRVTGTRCDFDRATDTAIVTGSPMLHRPGRAGEQSLNVLADTLEMRSGGKTGSALGNVRILRGSVEARSGIAIFDLDSDLLRLRREPVAIDPDGEVMGDSMAIVLKSGRAERLEVLGRARVRYRPSGKPGEKNFVWGDTLIARLDTLGVREIQVRGHASSFYFPSPADRMDGVGSNLSRGRAIRVDLEGGQARRVDLEGSASGEYLLPRENPTRRSRDWPDSLYVERALSFLAASPDEAASRFPRAGRPLRCDPARLLRGGQSGVSRPRSEDRDPRERNRPLPEPRARLGRDRLRRPP